MRKILNWLFVFVGILGLISVRFLEDKTIETDKIKHLTNIIIFELIHKKYSSKKIIQIIDDIFSKYQELEDGSLYSTFPHKLTCNNWEVSSNEFIKYQSELKNYIDTLTDKERIKAISNYLDKEQNSNKQQIQP